MPNKYGRQVADASLVVATAFPAAAATANSASIDTGSVYSQAERVEYAISWPALAALADTKNVIFNVQDSADGSSGWANIGITKTITGAGGAGVALGEYLFRLASSTRRYIRVSAALDSAGGTITASSFTVTPYF